MRKLTAADVMTRGVQTAEADWTLDELRTFLVSRSITGAPVCDAAGKLVGVISATDLMRAGAEQDATTDNHDLYAVGIDRRLDEEELSSIHLEAGSSTKVRDVMTPLVFEVAPDASLFTIADMMTRGRIHRVFVSRGEKLEGVVSALDLVRVVRDLTAPEG